MHVGTIKKTIFALMKIWARNLMTVDRVRDLVHLASRLDFDFLSNSVHLESTDLVKDLETKVVLSKVDLVNGFSESDFISG